MKKLPLLPATYFLVAVLVFALAAFTSGMNIARWLAVALTVLAFSMWIVARIQLGKAFSLKPKASFLVKEGLYAKIRHPVYAFSVLAALGVTIFFWNAVLLMLTIVLFVVEVLRARKEEQVLLEWFGDDYKHYRAESWF